ncbi:hypothetical protein CTI12_AA295660 [Artemisia annua]|uniref:Uncharacterized protein n=1 Tax=Artemisia annua TaxID=35608 RepID=A0A2U1N868_ARTAN|nr:hypothetical protein CTI12_AA295660 [Artemisia annua]
MSTPSNPSNTNASRSLNTVTHKNDGETNLLEKPTTQYATQFPDQSETQEKNKAEKQEKPKGVIGHAIPVSKTPVVNIVSGDTDANEQVIPHYMKIAGLHVSGCERTPLLYTKMIWRSIRLLEVSTYFRLPSDIPLIVVIVPDSMHAPVNKNTLHRNDMASRSPTRVDDCEDFETYVESVGLMYYKDLKQRLMKQSVLRVIQIHKGSRGRRALELNHKWRGNEAVPVENKEQDDCMESLDGAYSKWVGT